MGKILKQEIEFLQSLKSKQFFNTGSKLYIYTWGMPVGDDGRISTTSSFHVTFSPNGCQDRAEVAPGIVAKMKQEGPVPGVLHSGEPCYAINPNLLAILIWEPMLWTR